MLAGGLRPLPGRLVTDSRSALGARRARPHATPFAQQHLKFHGPPNSGRSVAEWAPSLKKATGASRPSLQQRLPGAEGPPEGCSTAPRHAACGGPIPREPREPAPLSAERFGLGSLLALSRSWGWSRSRESPRRDGVRDAVGGACPERPASWRSLYFMVSSSDRLTSQRSILWTTHRMPRMPSLLELEHGLTSLL